jgi:hypothetical protein
MGLQIPKGGPSTNHTVEKGPVVDACCFVETLEEDHHQVLAQVLGPQAK